MKVKVKSCPTLYNPMDCSLPGFSIHGIFQARILEWVAISFSRTSSWPRDCIQVSRTVGSQSLYRLSHQGSLKESESRSAVSDSLWLHGLYSPWSSLGQNAGVGSLSLLQGIFPTQGSNPGLPNCGWILYQLSHKGSPIEERPWVS